MIGGQERTTVDSRGMEDCLWDTCWKAYEMRIIPRWACKHVDGKGGSSKDCCLFIGLGENSRVLSTSQRPRQISAYKAQEDLIAPGSLDRHIIHHKTLNLECT